MSFRHIGVALGTLLFCFARLPFSTPEVSLADDLPPARSAQPSSFSEELKASGEWAFVRDATDSATHSDKTSLYLLNCCVALGAEKNNDVEGRDEDKIACEAVFGSSFSADSDLASPRSKHFHFIAFRMLPNVLHDDGPGNPTE